MNGYYAIKCLAILALLCKCVHAAKILGVFTMASYSHFTLGNRYMGELALRGHEVTYVGSYKDKYPPKGYRDVTLEGLADKIEEKKKELNMYELQNMPIFLTPLIFSQMILKSQKTYYQIQISKNCYNRMLHLI